MKTWITDANNNRASIERWGSEEEARKSLATLVGCSYCSDCSDCYDCSRCYGCSGCYGCYGCSGCSGCSRCSDCSRCYGCSGCYGCYGCSGCYGCYGCYGCSRCYGCSGCVDKKEDKQEFAAIPVIEDIHRKVLGWLATAVSRRKIMKSTTQAELFERGCAAAREIVASSGTAINALKKGKYFYTKFVQSKTMGFSDLEIGIWLGGFNATMLNKVLGDYQALEASVKVLGEKSLPKQPGVTV